MVHSAEESGYSDGLKQYDQSKSIPPMHSDYIASKVSYVSPDRNTSDGNQRSIVINKSKLLARYSVLYLGAAIPSQDQRGIESIQEPLSKRYPVDGKETVHGIETWLSIDENGLQIQYVADPSVIVYYPIRSLLYCAGVRFAKQIQTNERVPNGYRFVSLDSPQANLIENTQNPPIFTVTFRRTRHSPTAECHCFVAKTKYTALKLVEACYDAYRATDSQQDCSKVPLYFKVDDNGSKIKEIDNEIYTVPSSDQERTLDYHSSKEGSGFFYTTNQVPIDCWQLWEHHKNGTHRTASNYSSSSRSSRSSNRHAHHRPLASITPVPDGQKVFPRSQFLPTNNLTEKLSQPSIDPYAPVANVFRVERIKDNNSGRDIYVRWLHDKPKLPEQIPSYDAHVDFANDHQTEKILSKETKRSALNNEHLKKSVIFEDKVEPTTTYYERSKSKKKHRKPKHQDSEIFNEFYEDLRVKRRSSKTHRSHRPKYNEVFNIPSPTLIEQRYPASPYMQKQFPIPSSSTTFLQQAPSYIFHTIQQYPQSYNTNTSSPYWFYTM